MGRLIDGVWSSRDLGPDAQGRYVRRATQFRHWISHDGSTPFPATPGRYRLYVSHACGWSHRTLIFRRLKGLEDTVGLTCVEPFMGEGGWTLAPGTDPVMGARNLYELFVRARADYTGRASVPVLYDLEADTIVNNDSADIIQMFDRWGTEPAFFPEGRREEVLAMIAANYGPVNNGVYRAGFAASQQAHEEAVVGLFERLDALDLLLSRQRYVLGEVLTAADWCLFTTLYRFDAVYHLHFKCNLRHLWDYPHLWAYIRELYQTPGVRETCDMAQIKQHYYTSHESISPRRLVPLGPAIDFDAPHGREGL